MQGTPIHGTEYYVFQLFINNHIIQNENTHYSLECLENLIPKLI